jgi:threonine aldolase
VTAKIQEDFRFYIWDQTTGQVRWMCAWDTTEEDVEGLLDALRRGLADSL